MPARQTVLLVPDAVVRPRRGLGVPFLTAHRCLTSPTLPDRLGPGPLDGRTVLVAGGAGAVGNAAIQLARWADATVIATVSSPEKAKLAAAAGADHVIDYRSRTSSPRSARSRRTGVDAIVEVSPAVNAAIDAEVLALHGAVAVYANNGGGEMSSRSAAHGAQRPLAVRARLHEPARAKALAVEDVDAAVLDGAVRVGARGRLPLHASRSSGPPRRTQAVEDGASGKVIIDVTA